MKKNGFTVLEVMIVTAIAAILTVSASYLYARSMIESRVNQNANSLKHALNESQSAAIRNQNVLELSIGFDGVNSNEKRYWNTISGAKVTTDNNKIFFNAKGYLQKSKNSLDPLEVTTFRICDSQDKPTKMRIITVNYLGHITDSGVKRGCYE